MKKDEYNSKVRKQPRVCLSKRQKSFEELVIPLLFGLENSVDLPNLILYNTMNSSESRIYSEKAFKDYANSILISLSAGDDKYSHIAESDIVKCTQECTQKLDWLNASIAKQNDISKSAPLVITSDEINRAKQV